MPVYSFRCLDCGHGFEELVPRFGDKAPCPNCHSAAVEREVSAPAARVGDRLSQKLRERGNCGPGFS